MFLFVHKCTHTATEYKYLLIAADQRAFSIFSLLFLRITSFIYFRSTFAAIFYVLSALALHSSRCSECAYLCLFTCVGVRDFSDNFQFTCFLSLELDTGVHMCNMCLPFGSFFIRNFIFKRTENASSHFWIFVLPFDSLNPSECFSIAQTNKSCAIAFHLIKCGHGSYFTLFGLCTPDTFLV